MIEKIFNENVRAIGVVGNKNCGKTSLCLQELINLKDIGLKLYVYGVDETLMPYLSENGIERIENKEDILDLKLRNAIIYIDEFADVYDVEPKGKQGKKIRRFFNRLNHLNTWVLVSTAQDKFWNSFICSLIKDYIVKEIEYNSLINGTDLKTKVKGISLYSDYRLECPKSEYYVIGNNITIKGTFKYNPKLDSKKDNFNPFVETKVEEKNEEKIETKVEEKNETKVEENNEELKGGLEEFFK